MKKDNGILASAVTIEERPYVSSDKKELTEFLEETILVLKEELSDGYLWNWSMSIMRDGSVLPWTECLQCTSKYEEVYQMTELLVKPSTIVKGLRTEITA